MTAAVEPLFAAVATRPTDPVAAAALADVLGASGPAAALWRHWCHDWRPRLVAAWERAATDPPAHPQPSLTASALRLLGHRNRRDLWRPVVALSLGLALDRHPTLGDGLGDAGRLAVRHRLGYAQAVACGLVLPDDGEAWAVGGLPGHTLARVAWACGGTDHRGRDGAAVFGGLDWLLAQLNGEAGSTGRSILAGLTAVWEAAYFANRATPWRKARRLFVPPAEVPP